MTEGWSNGRWLEVTSASCAGVAGASAIRHDFSLAIFFAVLSAFQVAALVVYERSLK